MSTILSEIRSYPRSLIYILVLGFLLRLVFIVLHQRPLISDEREYDNLAYSLASTASYASEGIPTSYRPVGYPAFVAAAYYIVGHRPIAVKCFQALLDTAAALLIFLMLVGRTDRTKIPAVALWAFYIPAILYSNLLMSETVSAFLLLLIAFLISLRTDNRIGVLTSIGICFAFLVLIKPGTLVMVILVLILLPRLNIPLKSVYPAAIAFLLVVAPWIARNYFLFDRLALSSNSGINLLIGNNPRATGAYGTSFETEVTQDAGGEFDVDQRALRQAFQYIVDHPGIFVVNAIKKLGRLFESEGGLLVLTFHPNPEDATTHYASKYASIPLHLTLLTNLSYFLLLVLGVVGFLESTRDPIWWFTLSLAVSLIVVHTVSFGGGRFHFPLMPFAAIFAAQCVHGGRESIIELSPFRKIAGAIIVLLLASLWIYEGVRVFNA